MLLQPTRYDIVGCNSYIKYYEQKEEKNDPTEIRTKN